MNDHGHAPDEPDTTERRRLRDDEQSPTLWRGDGWTARVIKNEDDDGWAVSMTCDGESEPALVGPWTMGRDKKSPKPLDANAFRVLVKTANEILMRHEQQRRALLHRSVETEGPAGTDGERWRVDLDIVPDEDDPHAIVTVFDATGEVASRTRVDPTTKLTAQTARRWIDALEPRSS